MSAAGELAPRGVAVRPPSLAARLLGLGSVFGKSLRDARAAIIVAAAFSAGVVAVSAYAFVLEWDTLPERLALAAQMEALPAIFSGLLGKPVGLETLPGFLSWRVVSVLPILLGIWSIVALSGTLAGEAERGSLELLVAGPLSRARIATEKAVAHVVALGLALLGAALVSWAATRALAILPGDEASLAATVSHYAYVGVATLAGGAVAFALGPLLGRVGAAGVGAAVLYGSYVVNGYAGLVPGFDVLKELSYFRWLAGHRPLAGQEDPLPLLLTAALEVVLLGVGVGLFARRDLGATISLSLGPSRPLLPRGLGGPTARSFAERLPMGLAWGVGFGLFGFAVASSAGQFSRLVSESPTLQELYRRIYGVGDISSASGVLQLFFFAFGSFLIGLAAATFVAGWASDEEERRLDLVLVAPLRRRRWALASGTGVYGAMAVMTALVAAGAVLGAVGQGSDPVGPLVGIGVLGLYGMALGGIGLAAGGVGRAGLAGPIVAAVVVASFVVDLLGEILDLPDVVLELVLARHLGQPMLGVYDAAGLALCLGLAVGGLALGAWGFSRRDVSV